MKTKLLILALTLGVAAPVLAADTVAISSPSITTQIKKEKFPVTQLFRPGLRNENSKIQRWQGISSRSWTQTVGWHPGQNTSFIDAKNSEPVFTLVSLGVETH